MKHLFRGLVFSFLSLSLSSCSNTNGSLLSSNTTDLSSYTVTTTPVQAELMVSAYASSFTSYGIDQVQISGTCYASTYPYNVIYVTLNGVHQPITDASGVANPLQGAIPSAPTGAYCYQGRYNVLVSTGSMNAGTTTNLVVEIVAYDSTGAAYTNASQGQTNISISK